MPDWTHAFATWALALATAFAADRWLRELPPRWHPVGWMRRYLGWMGAAIGPRHSRPSPDWSLFLAGALAWYGGAMGSALVALVLQQQIERLPPLLAGPLLGLLLRPWLGWRTPRDEVAAVEASLAHSLQAGRQRLGRIVSHPVMKLDASQVRESAIASLARELQDALVAPVFWFVVGGLPGAVLYRFARTADAMWGWRGFHAGVNWEWAGKWAARAEDVLSWAPARLAALLVAMASGGVHLRALWREARAASFGGSWPVAAVALALGVRLSRRGGAALNADAPAPLAADTARALRLCAVVLVLLMAWALPMMAALHWGRSW